MDKTLHFEQGNNGNECFSFTLGFADFIEYLMCTAARPAACPSPSCLAVASERQRCISINRQTAPSKETSGSVSLSSSHYPSFLPFCQASSSSPLSLSFPLWLYLSPSIPYTPPILVRQALISSLFIIVSALDQASDCSSSWLVFPVIARFSISVAHNYP